MSSYDLPMIDYFRHLSEKIDCAEHGTKGQIITSAQEFLGVSRQKIYRGLQQHAGWSSNRKVRADKGDSDVSDDEIKFIVNLMLESTRDNKKRLLTWTDAVDIAEANGKLKHVKHPNTYSRVASERGLHPDQLNSPTPYSDMKSLHPNHIWQFDVSLCVLYYMDDNGLEPMDKKRFYQNKPQYMDKIKKKRVLRYLATDHTSGTMYLKYYIAAGEDQETLFEFFMDAFAKDDHAQDPFHGVPWMLIWDAGAANQSHLIKNLLKQLGVKFWHHMPGNPRAKGQVEGGHNIVERSFEGRLSMMNIRDVDHLNEAASQWMRWFNGTKIHSRHGHTRYQNWQTIKESQLRNCPPRAVCEELLQTKPVERQVKGNLVVSYKVKGYEPQKYSVAHIPNVRVGNFITICVNPYHAPNIFVVCEGEHGDEFISCEPITKDANGFIESASVWGEGFQSPADTNANTTRKEMLKDAYGVDTALEVDKARANREPTFKGEIDPISYMSDKHFSHYMDKKGIDVPVRKVQVEMKPYTEVELRIELKNKFDIKLSAEEYQQITKWYPEGVEEDELDNLANRLTSRPALRVVGDE